MNNYIYEHFPSRADAELFIGRTLLFQLIGNLLEDGREPRMEFQYLIPM